MLKNIYIPVRISAGLDCEDLRVKVAASSSLIHTFPGSNHGYSGKVYNFSLKQTLKTTFQRVSVKLWTESSYP